MYYIYIYMSTHNIYIYIYVYTHIDTQCSIEYRSYTVHSIYLYIQFICTSICLYIQLTHFMRPNPVSGSSLSLSLSGPSVETPFVPTPSGSCQRAGKKKWGNGQTGRWLRSHVEAPTRETLTCLREKNQSRLLKSGVI